MDDFSYDFLHRGAHSTEGFFEDMTFYSVPWIKGSGTIKQLIVGSLVPWCRVEDMLRFLSSSRTLEKPLQGKDFGPVGRPKGSSGRHNNNSTLPTLINQDRIIQLDLILLLLSFFLIIIILMQIYIFFVVVLAF